MISPKSTVTYAQYNEDTILAALLHNVKKGFYVDVGANYPTLDSVTNIFYENGWRGINIEPIKKLYEQFLEERPGDINLHCGAGVEAGTATLREYSDIPGHSTFDVGQKKQHDATIKYVDYEVPIRSLADILKEYDPKNIDFMKIDVEGFEYEVVNGNDWKKYRPQIICIEAVHVTHDWRKILLSNKYRLFIADGLNEYYVADEAWKNTINFAERVVKLNHNSLKYYQWQQWTKDSQDLLMLRETTAKQAEHIVQLEQLIPKLEEANFLSLKNRTLKSRLKRSAYGLTVDWIKYRKKNND